MKTTKSKLIPIMAIGVASLIYYRLAPSPTTTNGAQKARWAQWGWLLLAASLNMERRLRRSLQ